MKKEIHNTKQQLEEIGVKKDRFYCITRNKSDLKGYSRSIDIYMLKKDNHMILIGTHHHNTASYKGDTPSCLDVIVEIWNYKRKDGYSIKRKDIIIDFI